MVICSLFLDWQCGIFRSEIFSIACSAISPGALQIGAAEDDGKFFAAEPGDQIGRTMDCFSQCFGNFFQTLVSGLMSVCVVEKFEMVNIEQDQRNFGFETDRAVPFVGQKLFK